jgi:hypothetical protein
MRPARVEVPRQTMQRALSDQRGRRRKVMITGLNDPKIESEATQSVLFQLVT